MVRHLHFLLTTRDPFLENPGKFFGPEKLFIFVASAFKIKVSIILKMIQ